MATEPLIPPADASGGPAPRSRYRKLTALNRAIDWLLGTRSSQQALARLLRMTVSAFAAEGGVLELTSPIRARAAIGIARAGAAGAIEPPRATTTGRLDAEVRELAAAQGFPDTIRSYLATHFSIAGIRGWVALGSSRERAFRPTERPELVAFVRLGALGIAHAQGQAARPRSVSGQHEREAGRTPA